MVSKIKDSATAQNAAMNLDNGVEIVEKPGEPITPREKTTSEKLFPEFMTDDGGVVNRPVKPFEDKSKPLPVTATPEGQLPPAPQGQTPAAQTPTAPTYLKPEELAGKMVRLKVDGIEQDVPAESLIKTNQLERHLNTQLMNLAQERKQLEDEKRRLQAPPPTVKPDVPTVKKSAQEEALEARILQMQTQMETLQQTMLPAIQEAGKKRVAQKIKDAIGADDFDAYFERIRTNALTEYSKPEVSANPQVRAWFDSDAYYFQAYQEMKLKDLMAKPSTPAPSVNPSVPVLQTQQGAPVVMNSSGQPVSIPSFESSGGVPSKASPDASWQSTYNALFSRAQASGSMDDWKAFYQHKVRPTE